MLTIQHLTKKYGATVAVNDLSLTLQRGEIFGFIGPNGAGKSTTIRAVLNLIKKDAGDVQFDGQPLTPEQIALKQRIGYLPSEINLYENLTGRQMINYNQRFYQNVDQDYLQNLIKRLNFDENKKIAAYSLGNRKKLGIILCLMHNPDLIIMDEATTGLDPLMQEEFYQILREEKAKGKTIFFSSHYLEEVKKICDRIGIIKDGVLIKVDTVANLIATQGTAVTLFLSAPLKANVRPQNIFYENQNVIKFYHYGDKAALLKIVTNAAVNKFLVEELSLEDVFLHYYQEDK